MRYGRIHSVITVWNETQPGPLGDRGQDPGCQFCVFPHANAQKNKCVCMWVFGVCEDVGMGVCVDACRCVRGGRSETAKGIYE